jgi:hypothetical protein
MLNAKSFVIQILKRNDIANKQKYLAVNKYLKYKYKFTGYAIL